MKGASSQPIAVLPLTAILPAYGLAPVSTGCTKTLVGWRGIGHKATCSPVLLVLHSTACSLFLSPSLTGGTYSEAQHEVVPDLHAVSASELKQ